MKKIILFLLLFFAALFSISNGCKNNTVSPTESPDIDTTGSGPIVRKPNIYLYPERRSIISIKLDFPLGGKIIESIPEYKFGWILDIEPSGKINNQFDYIFYESQTPDLYQYNSGWVIARDSLKLFFTNNLTSTGFNEREIKDFIEYWIPELKNYSYYIIYPQFSTEIEKVIRLKFDIAPDNILRLFYIIQGSKTNEVNLNEPVIPKFNRSGFVVTEWGVVIK